MAAWQTLLVDIRALQVAPVVQLACTVRTFHDLDKTLSAAC